MKIAVRLEGGLGDVLCANRFVHAIKEKYPDSQITAYIDSEGKTFQKEALDILYPNTYKEIKIIPNKKYKEFWVDCQFGLDNYYGALENVPDSIREEMETQYDKFYDLHIDSLKWTEYDFDWIRYFKFFPKPELTVENNKGKYIVLHLVSSTSVGHRLEDWYLTKLISLLSKENKCIIVSTPDTNHFYNDIKDNSNVEIFNGSIEDVCKLISNASMMIATDSGFRYVAYGYGIPTFTFSKHSQQPFSSIPSHQIRWLMFPETCFPLNWDCNYIAELSNKILNNEKGYILTPYLQDFNLQAIKRNYKINLEKSIIKNDI
jgi:ADP-heptose:LPS heptosyltransferase